MNGSHRDGAAGARPPPGAAGASPARAWPARGRAILLCTEGTYPYVMGGVSSWCDLIVGGLDEFDWQVLPIVAPGKREPLYTLPPQAPGGGADRGVVRGHAAPRRAAALACPVGRVAGDARRVT